MQISSPELYLNAILLLINDPSEVSKGIVTNLLKLAEDPKASRALFDNETTKLYLRLLKSVIKASVSKDTPDELRILLLQFKDDPMLKSNVETYQLIHDTFSSTDKLTPEKINFLRSSLNNAITLNNLGEQNRQMFGALQKIQTIADPVQQEMALSKITDFSDKIKELSAGASTSIEDARRSYPGLIQSISMRDRADLKNAIQKHTQIVRHGALKLGLQGVNRLFGKQGGIVRGESIVWNAMAHNFKSGMLMSIARWIPLYNLPVKTAPGTTPLIWLTSLENEAWRDAMWMFRQCYENENGKSADGLSEDYIIDYTCTKFSEQGWELIIDRFLPEKFGYDEYVCRYKKLQDLGFEIVVSVVDYMNNMRKNPEESRDLAVRTLYNRMCNFTKSSETSLVTAHQLNREGMMLKQQHCTNIVKRLGPEHLSDSTDVQREVDFTAYLYLEVGSDGNRYLTIKRDKHRYVDDTPVKDQYTAYKFGPYGIPDDILGNDNSVADIYAVSNEDDTSASLSDVDSAEVF